MSWFRYYQKTSTSKWEKGKHNQIPKGYKFMTVLALNEKNEYMGPLYFDFDLKPEDDMETLEEFKARIQKVLEEVRKILNYIEVAYDIDIGQLQIWFTGSAGFHLIIHPQIIGASPHPHLPLIYKKIVETEFGDFKYIDRAVYSEGKGRMWRIPNIKRENGLHKIPVYAEEIISKDAEYFIELAKKKRKINYPTDYVVSENLNAVFENARILVESELFFAQNEDHKEVEIPEKYIAPCIKKIINAKRRISPEKNFNDICLILADYFANTKGISQNEAVKFLQGFFENYPSKSYPTEAKKEKEFLKKYRFVQVNQVKWSCGYAKWLGECKKCEIENPKPKKEEKKKEEKKPVGRPKKKPVQEKKEELEKKEEPKEEEENIEGWSNDPKKFPIPSPYLNPNDNTFHLENMPFKPDYKKLMDLKKFGQIKRIGLEELLNIVKKWYKNYDEDMIKLILAVITAHFFDGPPVWLLIRGAPSSGKTEFITALNSLPFTVDASDLTPKALFSSDIIVEGKKRKKTASWIASLNKKIMLFRDFTNTINSKNPNDRKEILSQLRGIYDGKYTRTVGKKGVTISWEGKIGLIGAATIIYDEMTIIEGEQFGERLLTYKLVMDDDFDINYLEQSMGKDEERHKEMQKAFLSFFHDFKPPDVNEIKVKDEYKEKISILQQLIARGRAPVKRVRGSNIIVNVPEIERAPRIEKQLLMILKALAVVHGRKEANDDDFRIITKIAVSNVPNIRWSIIKFLYFLKDDEYDPYDITSHYIASNLGYPRTTVYYHLEELCTHPIWLVNKVYTKYGEDRREGSHNDTAVYQLTNDCKEMLDIIPEDIILEY